MEKALQSVREAHQAELDNERYYQHQNYLAMQEQIKSLEEQNKKLSREKASICDELRRKLKDIAEDQAPSSPSRSDSLQFLFSF